MAKQECNTAVSANVAVASPDRRRVQRLAFKLLGAMRIAFSVFFGILSLLIVVWWVRSFSWADGAFLRLTPSEYVQVSAGRGRMCIWFEHNQTLNFRFKNHARRISPEDASEGADRIPLFHIGYWPKMTRVYAAHWVLALFAGLCAALPWSPRRFSLRFLVLSTTVFATVISVIVWVDNSF